MIVTRVKIDGGKVKLVGDGPGKYAWFRLGQFAIATMRNRVSGGIGSGDAPMPPLSGRTAAVTRDGKFVRRQAGYREQKQRAGLRPIRDLYGRGSQGGHLLDNFRVREAGPTYVRMDITSRWGRIKARANEKRAPWFGVSDGDARKILPRIVDMHRGTILTIGAKVRGGRSVLARAS